MKVRKFIKSSVNMEEIKNNEIDLIVTSPPYPMIKMWDELFISQDKTIDINKEDAFKKEHCLLNKVWTECDRVLKDGGIICINIGDAVRTIKGNFRIYHNHVNIIDFFVNELNYVPYPEIIWHKPVNSPTKFMGSGMLPVGAYVTLEHEYILIFRKGSKREFKTKEDKLNRQKSAYFWEERNKWFSDTWKINGIKQSIMHKERARSGAYPFEIPYRLINMYSCKGDIVLDPFMGVGTTLHAALCSERKAIGYDLFDFGFSVDNEFYNQIKEKRLLSHREFIKGEERCYLSQNGEKVKTKQEFYIEI